jgi:hypothetical protein
MKNRENRNFTKLALISLLIRCKKFMTSSDVKEKRLNLYITPTRHESFPFCMPLNAREKCIIPEHFSDMAVGFARKSTQKIKGEISTGQSSYTSTETEIFQKQKRSCTLPEK